MNKSSGRWWRHELKHSSKFQAKQLQIGEPLLVANWFCKVRRITGFSHERRGRRLLCNGRGLPFSSYKMRPENSRGAHRSPRMICFCHTAGVPGLSSSDSCAGWALWIASTTSTWAHRSFVIRTVRMLQWSLQTPSLQRNHSPFKGTILLSKIEGTCLGLVCQITKTRLPSFTHCHLPSLSLIYYLFPTFKRCGWIASTAEHSPTVGALKHLQTKNKI